MSANVDDNVDGIIVYYPVLNDIRDQKIKDLIDPSKDVEGLNSTLMSNKSEGYPIISISRQRKIFPVTPLAVVEILQYLELYDFDMPDGSRLSRLSITIINRSEVVGKPLAALLAHEGAYVYSVDVTGVQTLRQVLGLPTKLKFCDEAMTLDDCLALSDVIISGVPGNEFKVPLQSLKDDCICVNFSSEKNFDRDIKVKASVFVPSIGQVTIAVLMRNLMYLIKNKEMLLGYTRHLDGTSRSYSRHWMLRYLGIRNLLKIKDWYKPKWMEYAVCLVGISVGLLSIFT